MSRTRGAQLPLRTSMDFELSAGQKRLEREIYDGFAELTTPELEEKETPK